MKKIKLWKKYRNEFGILFMDSLLIFSMWVILKIVQFWNQNVPLNMSNSLFDFAFFGIYVFGFVYSLKVSFILVKKKKIKKVSIVIIHFLLLLTFTLISFTIIFKNPDSNNYLVSTSTQSEIWDTKSDFNNWFNSFYFSANTIVGGGYGDIAPRGTTFKILAVFEMIIGWVIFIIFFSELVSYVLNK